MRFSHSQIYIKDSFYEVIRHRSEEFLFTNTSLHPNHLSSPLIHGHNLVMWQIVQDFHTYYKAFSIPNRLLPRLLVASISYMGMKSIPMTMFMHPTLLHCC